MTNIETTVLHVAIAVCLGLLAHAMKGYAPFPTGDDFAYAPLADFRADPMLFARDAQLNMFANHAKAYEWVYNFGKSFGDIEGVFHAAILVQAAVCALALWLILRGLGAPIALMPAVIALGVTVETDGVGRGDFGGLISPFFHHHNIALALVLLAIAAALFRKGWLAGIALGVAAYAQPMTAFHGALITGLGLLLMAPRLVPIVALFSIIVATPVALPILGTLGASADAPSGIDLVTHAYRFRAPHHYDLPWNDLGLSSIYLLCAWLGAAGLATINRSAARFSFGIAAAFTGLWLVDVLVYKLGLSEWLPFYVLDANRSSPLLFVLGPAFLLAATVSASRPIQVASVALYATLLLLNGTLVGVVLAASTVVWLTFARSPWALRGATVAALAALFFALPAERKPAEVAEETRRFFEQIKAETPKDALFVIPVSLSGFRYYTERSAYVDFKLFSVAQPDQAALTRQRIDEVAPADPEFPQAAGWTGVALRDALQRRTSDCARIAEVLALTNADYYLRAHTPDESPPDCGDLPRPLVGETYALYGPPA